MSGWIKFEKDLETDPRTVRVAKALASRLALSYGCNADALPGVTLVCGALTRLWCYADSHIRGDDTLDAGAAELDEWVGIPGFCALLPTDWLVIIDENHVEFPGFLSHNGIEAKKKALTQKRVSNHRKRLASADCNAPALPDQTRPDHLKSPKPPLGKGASRQRRSPKRAERDRALVAWSEVITAEGATEDARARKALRAIGGYSRVRLRTVHEEPQIRREFLNAYQGAEGAAA